MKKLITAMLVTATTASGTVSLDQFFDPPSLTLAVAEDAYQSFTSGTNGVLAQVELLLSMVADGDRDAIVTIWNSDEDTSLGTVTLTPAELPPDSDAWVAFDFAPLNLTLQEGTTYFIGLSQGDGAIYSVNWQGSTNGTYAGGAFGYRDFVDDGFTLTDWDLGFRTYMSPIPEPSTSIFLLLGYAALLIKGCRTRPSSLPPTRGRAILERD